MMSELGLGVTKWCCEGGEECIWRGREMGGR